MLSLFDFGAIGDQGLCVVRGRSLFDVGNRQSGLWGMSGDLCLMMWEKAIGCCRLRWEIALFLQ